MHWPNDWVFYVYFKESMQIIKQINVPEIIRQIPYNNINNITTLNNGIQRHKNKNVKDKQECKR